MTRPDAHTLFTRNEVSDIVAAHDREAAFKTFLLERFMAYTRSGGVRNVAGIEVAPVDVASAADNGWAEWSLSPFWVDEVRKGLPITFTKRLRNGIRAQDRDAEVEVPVSFIFAESDGHDSDGLYEERVRTRTGYQHAKYVFVQAFGLKGQQAFSAWKQAGCPRAEVLEAYRVAHSSLMAHPADLKDVRRQVMDAAIYLCLVPR